MRMGFNFNLNHLVIKMKTILLLFALILLFGCSNNRNENEVVKFQKAETLSPIDDFPDTLSNDSSIFLYYSDRASVCVDRKRYHEAIQFFHRGKHLAIDKANSYLYLSGIWGFIHTKAAVDSVFSNINRAIENDPKNSIYYFARSRFYNDIGNNTEALKDIEIAIKYSPSDNKTAYVNQRGAYKMIIGDFKGAAKDVKNIAEGNKDNAEFFLTQSMIYNQLDMHKEALVSATKLIELDSNIAQAYVVRGNALHYLKRKDESLRDFYKARDLGDTTAIEYIKRHENKTKQK
jgi:tetratricopeptide (TPR) repeat protein